MSQINHFIHHLVEKRFCYQFESGLSRFVKNAYRNAAIQGGSAASSGFAL